jgi:hypothetical protein
MLELAPLAFRFAVADAERVHEQPLGQTVAPDDIPSARLSRPRTLARAHARQFGHTMVQRGKLWMALAPIP